MQEQNSLKVHKAHSFKLDPRQAVAELQQSINCPNMAAVVFFCSIDYDLKALGQELKSTFQCPVIGCTTAGEIGPGGYCDHSLTAFSIESKNLLVYPNLIASLDTCTRADIELTASNVTEQVKAAEASIPNSKPFGFFLIDGMSGKEEQIIGQLYHTLGSIPIVGGSAGGGDHFAKTWVYYDGEFYNNAASITMFVTSLPFEVFRTQHFVPIDGKLVITKAEPESRKVIEINGRPAAAEYARVLGFEKEELNNQVFATHPVMLKLGGEYYVRSCMRQLEDGSLQFACAIDEGLVLTMAQGVDMVENLREALDALEQRMKPQVIIGCECFFRKIEVLERDIQESMGRIMARHNVIGFHTYGEQINAVHVNQTFTGVAIGS